MQEILEMRAKQGPPIVQSAGEHSEVSQRIRPSPDAPVGKSTASSRILVVDDQEDVRQMLATALGIEGYDVDEAANAQQGLRQLRQGHYDLVLTDYAMPGRTGTWMLREASRRGLMDHTAALIVTAHPEVRGFAGAAVLYKPLDLDDFLERVRRVLAVGPILQS